MRVLLIDDSEDLCFLALAWFRRASFDLEIASDPVDGLRQYGEAKEQNCPYSLLIIDYSMPGMSGVDLIRRVREEDSTTKVIIYTANKYQIGESELASLDVLEVIEKGDVTDLEKGIERALHGT